MKEKYKFMVCCGIMFIFSFWIWMGVLSGAASYGILDLDTAAECEDVMGMLSYVLICLAPPFFMSICAADVIINEMRRGLFGHKIED